MSETWRRKPYYRPRVLIDVGRVLDPQFEDALLCITGEQLEMLRNLTQYLHRRSTFVAENHDGYYLVADNDDWDAIQAIVSDLEETLMGCEEFTALFEAMLAQLQCVCNKTSALLRYGPSTGPIIEGYLVDETLIPADTYGGTTPADASRCAIAQLTYWQAWELLTEVLQPAQETLMDVLVPTVIALLVSIVGTPVLGIPAGLLIATLMALSDAAVEGSLTSVQNAYRAYQDEIVCALYLGLDISYREAESQASDVIEGMEGLSPIDMILLQAMVAPWAISLASTAYTNATAWALANVEAGYCDDCDEVLGTDWWALYMDKDTNTVEMLHPVGAYWAKGCWQYSIPAGQTVAGVIFQVKNITGNCTLKRMSAFEAECTGSELWGNRTENLEVEGQWYFGVNGTNIDEVECKARLAPGSIDKTDVWRYDGPLDINAGFNMGWSCTGNLDIHIAWVVFEGTTPP